MKNYSFSFKSSKDLLLHLESLAVFACNVASSDMPCRDLFIDKSFIETSLKSMRKHKKLSVARYSFPLYVAFREHGFESGLGSESYSQRVSSFTDVICEYVIRYDYEESVFTFTQYFHKNE